MSIKWPLTQQLILDQGALRMVGRRSFNPTASRSIVTTGIPGMSGHSDMKYNGVVRMRGMPYRFVYNMNIYL